MRNGQRPTLGCEAEWEAFTMGRWFWRLAGCVCLLAAIASSSAIGQPSVSWEPFGAAPNTGGQVENLGDGEVSGAVQAVAPHPSDKDVLFIGAVNGGIWVTRNAMDAAPQWTHLTDDQPSLAIGALEFDPTDGSHQTLVAGTGQFSSFGIGGARAGLLRTTDGGATWKVLNKGGLPAGLNVTGVAPRGDVIVVSASGAADASDRGIWRSTDAGETWTQVSGASGSGLPAGESFDLASDPRNPQRLFTNASGKFYRSSDTGATWSRVSSPAMETKLLYAQNVEAAVGHNENVFVAIVGPSGQLAAVFHSGDGGGTWSDMGVPMVGNVGIHPGSQGSIHLSIAADPANANLVYVGGDRQDGQSFPIVPNAIGAHDFSGCLFRGDVAAVPARRWAHLTHSKSLGVAGGGTASSSAPHADSRDMAVASNGVLIEADDGGVYKRTSPHNNSGDWFSVNGNLQTAEYHAVAWDSNADIVVAGAQDTGTSEQFASLQPRFRSIATADGGVVAVDDQSTPGYSIRYSSYQYLGRFQRRVFDSANNLHSAIRVPLTVLGGGSVAPQFYTPIALNAVDPERLIVGASGAVFESLDQGDTCRRLTPSVTANGLGLDTIAYGAADNLDVLYVGAGSNVFVRTSPYPAPLAKSPSYAGGPVRGITHDPGRSSRAFVASPVSVYQTTDAGISWSDLSAKLATLDPGILHSIAFIPGASGSIDSVLVGGDHGVFLRQLSPGGTWTRLGGGLPRVPVYHLEYDATDDILLAGTLGRGAWRLATPTPGAAIAALSEEAASPAEIRHAADEPAAENTREDSPVELQEGVVVDVGERRIYLMRPQGGTEAIALDNGQTLWVAPQLDKPLELSSNLVIGQAASEVNNVVKIIAVDRKTGDEVIEGEHALPPGISPSVDATFAGTFSANVTTSGENAFLSWHFVEQAEPGLPPGFKQGLAPNAAEDVLDAPRRMGGERVGVRSGVIQMNLDSGETNSLNIETPVALAAPVEDSLWIPEGPDRLKDIAGEQYRSVDGRHIVSVVRTGKGLDWDRYTLSIHERQTGNRIGQIKSHVTFVPLVVAGNYVVYQTSPSQRRVSGRIVEEPLSIRVDALKDGAEVWSRPVRDTSYRGPLPP